MGVSVRGCECEGVRGWVKGCGCEGACMGTW